jgi:2-keto-3-deoxy-L-rhamnonate aldolase RhmA
VLKTDKALCTLASGFEAAQPLFEKGYRMVTLMADGIALARAAADQAARFRNAYRS